MDSLLCLYVQHTEIKLPETNNFGTSCIASCSQPLGKNRGPGVIPIPELYDRKVGGRRLN